MTAHYDPEGEPVIRSLSFQTKAAEKIGIVGRTVLLKNRRSHFSLLVKDTGAEEARQLKRLAKEKFHINLKLDQAGSTPGSPQDSDEEVERVEEEEGTKQRREKKQKKKMED